MLEFAARIIELRFERRKMNELLMIFGKRLGPGQEVLGSLREVHVGCPLINTKNNETSWIVLAGVEKKWESNCSLAF